MAHCVAGDLYYELDGQLSEIKRQIRQPNGYPFDPAALKRHLQAAIEGRFDHLPTEKLLTVDYSVRPSLVSLEVVEHPDRAGVVTIDLGKIEWVLTLKSGENYVGGEENLKRLKARAKETGETILDVRVMEELLVHPHLIPEEWKSGYTYFWGTIFRDSRGGRHVACLIWRGERWIWYYRRLEDGWREYEPAAVLRK